MAEEKKEGREIQAGRPPRAVSPFEEMERWFENFFSRGWPRPLHSDWPSLGDWPGMPEGRMPKVDVIDRDAEVVVRAEVPGVSKDELDVSVADNTVTIKGETKREEKEEKGDYYRSETSRGVFARTVALPAYVDAEGASARFKDGVLELTLPKVEKARRRTIKVD